MPKSAERQSSLAHNDNGFLRPDAWAEAKQAFGLRGDVAQMLEQLEHCAVANPRLLLAAAIHEFLRISEDDRRRAVEAYLRLPHTTGAAPSEDPKRRTSDPNRGRKPASRKRLRRS